MTIAELDRWSLEARWAEVRRQKLHEYLERFVILPYDRQLLYRMGWHYGSAKACGRRIECADAWIAATAQLYDVPLITHNRSDYIGVPNLTIISHAP